MNVHTGASITTLLQEQNKQFANQI